jgi:hypothetical protein
MTELWSIARYRAYLQGQPHGNPFPSAAPVANVPPDRYKSDTERRYAAVLDGWQHDGDILRWWYEPQKGLYLAPKTSYSPDFLLDYGPGRPLEFHEVKGAHIWPKDWILVKQAAALYPCYRFFLAQWKDAQWHWQGIPAV